MSRLLLATTNPGKLRELRALLAPAGIELETLADHPDVRAPEETGDTFEANARIKASAAAAATGRWALGEDSGLEVDSLGGAPGVYSARFAGTEASDRANNELLLSKLEGQSDRRARYACAMALARPDGEVVAVAHGTCEGAITLEPRGADGFGYDPLFRPEGRPFTMAELAPEDKDAISHRGRAARALIPMLRLHLGD